MFLEPNTEKNGIHLTTVTCTLCIIEELDILGDGKRPLMLSGVCGV